MKALMLPVALAASLSSSSAHATASFANRELGLGVGGFTLLGPEIIDWGVPVTLEGGYYIEDGWGLYLRIPLLLLSQPTGFGVDKLQSGIVLATGGQFGVRYLFLQEAIRPYVMLHLAGLYFFRDSTLGANFYAGPGVGAGVDFFVADSVSLGLRGTFDVLMTVNPNNGQFVVLWCPGGAANVTVYF